MNESSKHSLVMINLNSPVHTITLQGPFKPEVIELENVAVSNSNTFQYLQFQYIWGERFLEANSPVLCTGYLQKAGRFCDEWNRLPWEREDERLTLIRIGDT